MSVGRQEDELGIEVQTPASLGVLPEGIFVRFELVPVLASFDLILDDDDEGSVRVVEFQPQVASRGTTSELMSELRGHPEATERLGSLRRVASETPEGIVAG